MKTLRELVASWPERAIVPLRLHLYGNDDPLVRCDWKKFKRVFDCAKKFNISATISTNTNRWNAVYVMLSNYVLAADINGKAYKNWGYDYQFVCELAKMFPGYVFIDQPASVATGERYVVNEAGEIIEVIQTDDGMC